MIYIVINLQLHFGKHARKSFWEEQGKRIGGNKIIQEPVNNTIDFLPMINMGKSVCILENYSDFKYLHYFLKSIMIPFPI